MTSSRPTSEPTTRREGPSRRVVLASGVGTAAALGLAAARRALARPENRTPDAEEQRLDDRRRLAVKRGAAYLASQQREDGRFGADDRAVVALTALSVLALMAEGSTDGRGPHGHQIERGLDTLLKLVEEPRHGGAWHEGYFYHSGDQSSRMHGQGYATLALATAIGSAGGKRYVRIRDVLRKAVACIEQAQSATGGFGYNPVPAADHEGSVTVAVAQGLRAARDAGLVVDEQVVKKGLKYLRDSQNDDGSFRYALHVNRSSYALTAAALSSFFLYGLYGDRTGEEVIKKGLAYMMKQTRTVLRTGRWYYYGNFYAAWTCWQKDGADWDPRTGGYWARWHREVYPHLIDGQRHGDGGWRDENDNFEFGDVLPTAFAVLTLAIPDEVLPIFQR